MYWLLSAEKQQEVRWVVDTLVKQIALVPPAGHDDQLFPYVGRKHRGQANAVVNALSRRKQTVCDPFAGSGVIAYAIAGAGRLLAANEYEPYTNRMANAPWRLPDETRLKKLLTILSGRVSVRMSFFYRTVCSCGTVHVLDSLFFDREPLRYENVAHHERLGRKGQNVTYRPKKYRCPTCDARQKFFDESDRKHLQTLDRIPLELPVWSQQLIENSRINLSSEFTTYGSLFPHRSRLALELLWKAIQGLEASQSERMFFEDVFLSILPQAKYKDYRSKSQDLHCPPLKLREVNTWHRFRDQFRTRLAGLQQYSFATDSEPGDVPIECLDFRDYMESLGDGDVTLVLTDPPWADGNAYFEKAQLYHPWIGYSLIDDTERLEKEVVVTDAPSRPSKHDIDEWWNDIDQFFQEACRVLADSAFMALFFRPIPARRWLQNLNRIKLLARRAGFEPLLPISIDSDDPSMRVQQSAYYTFTDVIMLFLKLAPEHRRVFVGDVDLDQMVFQAAELLQDELGEPFTHHQWRDYFRDYVIQQEIPEVNHPQYAQEINRLFERYCDQVSPGKYLPKPSTPFSGQMFDVPAIERLSTYVPVVINTLAQAGKSTFSFTDFLLGLAEYVENGTRSLIRDIEHVDIRALIETYAEPVGSGKEFKIRPLPALPEGITRVLELDPYDFEAFVAHLLEKMQYSNVALLGRAGDRGVDVIATDPDGQRTVVQCKRYLSTNVDAVPIQRLDSYARTRNIARKVVVTTTDFTRAAEEEARITGTELVNSEKLEAWVAQYMPDWEVADLR